MLRVAKVTRSTAGGSTEYRAGKAWASEPKDRYLSDGDGVVGAEAIRAGQGARHKW